MLIKQMLTFKEVLPTTTITPLATPVKTESIDISNSRKEQDQAKALIYVFPSTLNEFPLKCYTAAIRVIIKEYNDVDKQLICRIIQHSTEFGG